MFLVGKGLIVSGLIWQSNLRFLDMPFLSPFSLYLSLYLASQTLCRQKAQPAVLSHENSIVQKHHICFFHYLATAASAAGQKQKAWRITFPIDFHAAQYFWRWGRGCRFPRFLPPPFPHAKRRQGPFVILRLFGHASCLAWLLKIPAAPCRCGCPE